MLRKVASSPHCQHGRARVADARAPMPAITSFVVHLREAPIRFLASRVHASFKPVASLLAIGLCSFLPHFAFAQLATPVVGAITHDTLQEVNSTTLTGSDPAYQIEQELGNTLAGTFGSIYLYPTASAQTTVYVQFYKGTLGSGTLLGTASTTVWATTTTVVMDIPSGIVATPGNNYWFQLLQSSGSSVYWNANSATSTYASTSLDMYCYYTPGTYKSCTGGAKSLAFIIYPYHVSQTNFFDPSAVSDTAILPDCQWTNPALCITTSFSWAFVPRPEVWEQFQRLTWASTAPIGYVGGIRDLFNDFATATDNFSIYVDLSKFSSTSPMATSVPIFSASGIHTTLGDTIWNMIQNLLAGSIYLMYLVFLYLTARHFL